MSTATAEKSPGTEIVKHTTKWPDDMQPTGKSYAGFLDGVCVAVGMQFSGKRGERENRSTLRDFAGYDIQTLPHADAVAALQAGLATKVPTHG